MEILEYDRKSFYTQGNPAKGMLRGAEPDEAVGAGRHHHKRQGRLPADDGEGPEEEGPVLEGHTERPNPQQSCLINK